MIRTIAPAVLAALAACAAPAFAETQVLSRGAPMAAWPGADHDPAIPTLKAVVGHDYGEEITASADVRRYFEALAAAAPDRVRLVEHGRSWEGRPLYHVLIAAPETIARLDAIKADVARVREARGPEADAAAARLPAVVWLAYSVHGDEIGPAEAAMATAHHLLAARGDPRVARMMAETLTIIAPVQNPDGRDRFIATSRGARGLAPDADPLAAERDQPWPPGRFNHYLFDLNRDWFAQTQPETRAHSAAMLEWLPTIVADVHEMGTDRSYFFPPAAPPTNPLQTATQQSVRERIGRINARWFDRFGLPYFTREDYDLFYPGYGDGWPSYHGAASLTYEQGSARGLAARRRDGTRFTFADTIQSQLIASLGAIEAGAENRAALTRDLLAYRRSAIAEGARSSSRTVVIPRAANPAGADGMAALLARQGVTVQRAGPGASACGRSLQAGDYVVDTAQPAGRLARVLLDPGFDMEADFVKEQERRRARGLPDQIYDVTAWSLPMLFNLETTRCRTAPAGTLSVATAELPPGRITNPDAAVAFLAPWGDAAAVRLLAAGLRDGLSIKTPDAAFTADGRRFPSGSLVIERAANGADLAERLTRLARETGAEVVGVDDSWVSEGPNFGSDRTLRMPAPRIAMAWDDPTDPSSAGAARFVIERQIGYPVTAIRTERLARADLSGFDVLVLPQARGDYGRIFGEAGTKALKDWTARGGVVIALGSATRFLADPKTDLLSIRREDLAKAGDEKSPKADEDKATRPGVILSDAAAYEAAIRPDRRPPDAVAGVLVRARTDGEHWLGAGLADTLHVMASGTDIYTPAKRDEGDNVVRFEASDRLVASGYLWAENRAQLAFKPVVVVEPEGRGYVIGFTQDPTTRGFMHGLTVLMGNALFRSAAHAEPVRR